MNNKSQKTLTQQRKNKSNTVVYILLVLLGIGTIYPSHANEKIKELRGGWKELEGCKLVEASGNDGDSFHVEHLGKEYVFRLYLVDCPETDIEMIGRNVEQIQDFEAPLEKLLITGKLATELTKTLLSRPFTVLTKGEDAMGRSQLGRSYAFVTTSKGEDLGEVLLEHGLARSHGKDTDAPTMHSNLRQKYDRIAERSKRQDIGAWGKKEIELSSNSLVSVGDLSRAKREIKELQKENKDNLENLAASLGKENLEIQKN
jgi:endonuclease YncB( thermonuclease family)